MNFKSYIVDVNKKQSTCSRRFVMNLVKILAMAIECILFLVIACFAEGPSGDANRQYETSILNYVVGEIAPQYAKSDVTIPVVNILAVDSSQSNETLVWGSFWVLNYELRGDTLFCVSGGDHSGLAYLQQSGDGSYFVKKLEVVEDGAKFTKSAKRIFGKHYKSFMKIYSDKAVREKKRAETIRDYVKANGLPITKYQDYGWEAKAF